MRVFAALMMACLAVGAYGASLELEHLRRVLNLLARKEDGPPPPPPCLDQGGIRVDLPRGPPGGPPPDFQELNNFVKDRLADAGVVINAQLEKNIQDAFADLNLPAKEDVHDAFEACKPVEDLEDLEDSAEKELIAELRELLGRSAEDKPLLVKCVQDKLEDLGFDVPTGPLPGAVASVYMRLDDDDDDDDDDDKPPGFLHLHDLAIVTSGLKDCRSDD